ncbi:MAG: MarR family transcriptional regulator [Desulfuromonadaceae bacterium]|nr:MarR family transcriptional regulator [Desulfuromonadaceae bacterium]
MYNIEKSIGFLLAKGYQRAWALLREEIEVYDLTPPQFGLLAFLWQQDGVTQAELSENGQIDRTTIGGLIDRLEKSGLVERRPHPQDRRAYKIYLTKRGKEIETPLSECAKRAVTKLTNGLSKQEIGELTRMLEILRGERRVYEIPSC